MTLIKMETPHFADAINEVRCEMPVADSKEMRQKTLREFREVRLHYPLILAL